MLTCSPKRTRGFVLIEALIALLVVSLGALAMAKLESLTLSAAGESRSRSEAMAIAQRKMEQLRNVVLVGQMPTTSIGYCDYGDANCPVSTPVTSTYRLAWNYNTGSLGVQISLTTSWTDRFNNPQSITLNSRITWDNPLNQSKASTGFKESPRPRRRATPNAATTLCARTPMEPSREAANPGPAMCTSIPTRTAIERNSSTVPGKSSCTWKTTANSPRSPAGSISTMPFMKTTTAPSTIASSICGCGSPAKGNAF